MKTIFSLARCFLVFLLHQTSYNALLSQNLSSNDHLLAHFEFNSSFTDSSPNHIELDFERRSYSFDRFGNESFSSFFWPMVGPMHQISTPLFQGKTPVTISFWANPFNWNSENLEPPSPMDIMNYSREGNDPEIDKDEFWLQFAFDIPNETQTLVFNARTHVANIDMELQEDSWKHYAIVLGQDNDFAYNNIQFYIDGTSAAVTSSENWNEQEYDLGANPFNIGRSFLENSNAYIGYIDELRIYNAALNPEEIKSLHEFEKTYDPIAAIPPRSAVIEPVVVDGILRDFNILDSGAGYVEPPELYLVGQPDAGSDYRVSLKNGQVTRITKKLGAAGVFKVGRRFRAIIGSAPFDSELSMMNNQEGGLQLGMKVRVRTSYQLFLSQDLKVWEPLFDPIHSLDETVFMDIDADGVGKYYQLRIIE